MQDAIQGVMDKAGFSDESEFDKISNILGSNEYWNHVNEIEDFEFSLQCMRLKKRAKLTDFLQFSPKLMNCPFLISTAVKELLSSFNLYGAKFWPATVVQSAERVDFHLPHFNSVGDEVIDFSKSTFYSGSVLSKKMLKFHDAVEKKVFSEKNHVVKYDQVFFNDHFDPTIDLFMLPNAQMIASERLKEKLEAGGFTGIRLLPAFGDLGEWLKLR